MTFSSVWYCGDERRLGFSEPVFQNAKETLCVDHHVSNESFADTNYIVPDASSTSELVFRLLDEEKITEKSHLSFIWGLCMIPDVPVFLYFTGDNGSRCCTFKKRDQWKRDH